ncbi:hypothetical protein BC567DRAFT_218004 [Phyllosticta citribraziliensis]
MTWSSIRQLASPVKKNCGALVRPKKCIAKRWTSLSRRRMPRLGTWSNAWRRFRTSSLQPTPICPMFAAVMNRTWLASTKKRLSSRAKSPASRTRVSATRKLPNFAKKISRLKLALPKTLNKTTRLSSSSMPRLPRTCRRSALNTMSSRKKSASSSPRLKLLRPHSNLTKIVGRKPKPGTNVSSWI